MQNLTTETLTTGWMILAWTYSSPTGYRFSDSNKNVDTQFNAHIMSHIHN